MTLAIISDLHLPPAPGGGAFTHSVAGTIQAIEALLEGFDKVVIAGDLFDLDLSPRLWDREEGLKMARSEWGDVLQCLDNTKVQIIHGNHDILLKEEGVPEKLEFAAGPYRLEVVHGHQFRAGWRLREGIKAPVKWGANRLKGTALGFIGEGINRVNEGKEALEAGVGLMGRGALSYLRSREEVDMLIYGHTHRPGVWVTPYGTLANSGSWAYGRRDYLAVDLDGGEVVLRQAEGL